MNLIIKFNKKLTLNNRIKGKKTKSQPRSKGNFHFFFIYRMDDQSSIVIILSVEPYEPHTKKMSNQTEKEAVLDVSPQNTNDMVKLFILHF